MTKVYLDNAATTPLAPEVITYMTEVLRTTFGNPSSTHQFGRSAKVVVEEARKYIAKQFQVTPGEVFFTSGGSEADNLILRNAVANLGVQHIVTSVIEHHAVLHTIKSLQKEFNIEVTFVPISNGMVELSELDKILNHTKGKTLVSLMHINNELGTILPMAEVAALCKERKALFHSDTVQTIGHFTLDLQKTPIDFITASAHKFHGPKGIGFAIIKKPHRVQSLIIGGEQERGVRAGTENVHNIAGMHKALQIAYDNLEKDHAYIAELKQYFVHRLKEIIPNVTFNGHSDDAEKSSYIIVNVRFPKEIPMFLFNLDLKGVAASGGSACQSGSSKGSHVLQAILTEEEAKKTSVRFSFSKFVTKEEVDYTLSVLQELV